MFTHTLVSEVITRVLKNIGDSNGVTWTRSEVMYALKEGVQVLDVLGFFNRKQVVVGFPTDTSFVDIFDVADLNTDAAFNKSIAELKLELDRHLLEDATSRVTIDNEVFDRTQYDERIKRKVDEFLLESGIIVKRNLYNIPADSDSYDFPSELLNVRRLAMLVDESYRPVNRETESNVSSFFSDRSIDSVIYPNFYSQSTSKRNSIRLYPRTGQFGKLEVLGIYSPNYNSSLMIQVVSNLSWAIKYGILYEYYSDDGEGKDAKRAEYCKNRWEQAIQIAKNYPFILGGKIAGLPIRFDDVFSFDKHDRSWQNRTVTNIANLRNLRTIAMTSWNMFAVPSKLQAGIDADIVLDILPNTPLPTDEDDYVQIPIEFIPTLEAYMQHYLFLKFGTDTFYAGMEKLNRLLQEIIIENQRLNIPGNEFLRISVKKNREVIHRPIQEEQAA